MELLAGAALLAAIAGTAAGALVHAAVRSRLQGEGTLGLFALCGLGAAVGGSLWMLLTYVTFGGPEAYMEGPPAGEFNALFIVATGVVFGSLFGAITAAWPPRIRRPVRSALHRLFPMWFPQGPSPSLRRFGCAASTAVGLAMTVAYLVGFPLGVFAMAAIGWWSTIIAATLLGLTPTIALLIRRAVRQAR